MAQHARDLRLPALAGDPAHQPGQPLGLTDPAGSPALADAPEIDELHGEPTALPGHFEHARLQRAGEVPARLAANRGVEGEDEPTRLPRRQRRQPLRRAEKTVDLARLRMFGWRGRSSLAD